MLNGIIVGRALLIVILGFGLGALNKLVNPNAPGWIGYYPVSSEGDTAIIPEAAEPTDPEFISVGAAADLFNRGVLFVDARDEWDYQQGHVRGAVNVPFEGDESILEEFLASADKSRDMVVYCSGAECDLSLYLGRTLQAEGFTGVHIFFGGWNDWVTQELPTDGSDSEGENAAESGSEG